eukprot:jgi/Botrbrau1/12985/Bobra.384_1s0010.1
MVDWGVAFYVDQESLSPPFLSPWGGTGFGWRVTCHCCSPDYCSGFAFTQDNHRGAPPSSSGPNTDPAHCGLLPMSDPVIMRLIIVKPPNHRPVKGQGHRNVLGGSHKSISEGLRAYETQKANQGGAQLPRNLSARFYGLSDDDGAGAHADAGGIGWYLGSHDSESNGFHVNEESSADFMEVSSVPASLPVGTFDHPSHALLRDHGYQEIPYHTWRTRCLEERRRHGPGQSEDMNLLYRFWTYFLRDNLNQSMYNDFKSTAIEDGEANMPYGLECLFRFFSYGLESSWDEKLYRDFEELTLTEYRKEPKNLYGLEKFWAYHHYRRDGVEGPSTINPELNKLLEGEYKSLSSFRTGRPRHSHQNLHPHPHPHPHRNNEAGTNGRVSRSQGQRHGQSAPVAAAQQATKASKLHADAPAFEPKAEMSPSVPSPQPDSTKSSPQKLESAPTPASPTPPNGKHSITVPVAAGMLPNGVHLSPSKSDSSSTTPAGEEASSPGAPTTPERAPSPAVHDRAAGSVHEKPAIAPEKERKDACTAAADLPNGSLAAVEGGEAAAA